MRDGARVLVTDDDLRRQLLLAFTQDSRLHVQEVRAVEAAAARGEGGRSSSMQEVRAVEAAACKR